ncbi:hypothetical protein P3X46_021950, partial [Hevea brasiliensis]
DDSEFIQDIAKGILNKLRRFSPSIAKDYVGMDSRMEKMRLCMGIEELNTVKMVGICGMGGIGKTSIAGVIYKEMQCQFEGSAFLADVRETSRKYGLVTLQRQLLCATLMERDIDVYDVYNGVDHIKNRLSRKKVLVILDDVDELEQLELLIGKKDENWFGVGSRIILTTRDEHLLIHHEVDQIYRVEELNHHEALQLFCLKAFKKDFPPEGYMELSNQVVNYAGGLPLALKVLGSSLYARPIREWSSALERLKEVPNEKILNKLEISFDGLEDIQKKIFLDIACFFKGKTKDYVMKVMKSVGLYPDIGIRELIDKSLIAILDNQVWMHDLLQEMGQEIVRRECREEPGQRSRLWLYEDVCHIFMNDTGTTLIKGVVMDYIFDQGDRYLSSKAFLKMKALRFLILSNLNLSKDIEYLSNELRYLEWYGYPFKSLPQSFQPDQLVELHMSYSSIEQLWKGVRPLKLLKIIDLSYSKNLIMTPDFREIPYLEELILECCTGLLEVHHSIGLLQRIVLLNLKNCKSLVALPSSLCNLKSLKVFILSGCSNLEEMPDKIGDMTSLEVFDAAGIGSTLLPSVQPWDCLCPWWPMPKKNPPAMSLVLPSLTGSHFLMELDLSYCSLTDAAIPDDLSCFPFLSYLDLSGNDFVSMPASISQLSKLLDFRFANCKRLHSFPNLPSSIMHLSMEGCSCLDTSLLTSISGHFKLENLHLVDCRRLQSLPDLSSIVLQLSVEGRTTKETVPNPFEENILRPSSLTFITCLKLVEIQGNNRRALARLISYLHFILRHGSQGLFSPSTIVSVCLSASEVPVWFNYQGSGSSLEVQLPPYWLSYKWMGFFVSVVIRFHDDQPAPDTFAVFCDLHAYISPDQSLFLGRSTLEISQDLCIGSDQLCLNFVPRSSITCLDQLEGCNHLKTSFFSDQLEVKNCGFRPLYSQDIDELILCNKPFENGLPGTTAAEVLLLFSLPSNF